MFNCLFKLFIFVQPIVSLAVASQSAVETSLRFPIKIVGQADEPMRLHDRLVHTNTPGISVAVVEDGELAWAKGYGLVNAQVRQAVDENTLFQAASISKMVTAVGVLLLVQEGKLDLDVDVNTYLKRWKVPKKHPFESEPLTLRHLLSHTGGVTVQGVAGYEKTKIMPTIFEFLDGFKPISKNDAVEVVSKPGDGFQYSGGGTAIVEILIEDVTGMSFKDYIQKTVFDALEMTRSTFVPPHVNGEKNYASGHFVDGAPLLEEYNDHPSLGAAGLWTTPTDLVKLGMNIQKSIIGDTRGLLNQKLAKEMIACTVEARGDFAGFGCFISKDGMIFKHSGGNPGMRCNALFTTDGKKGVVIMTNSDNGMQLENELRLSVLDIYKWPVPPSLEKNIVTVDPSLLQSYAGEFWMVVNKGTEREKIVKSKIISVTGNHLSLQSLGDDGEDYSACRPLPLISFYPESVQQFFSQTGLTLIFEGTNQFKIGDEVFFKESDY